MFRILLLLTLFIFLQAFSFPTAEPVELLDFLKENAVEVKEDELEENIRYFLDVSFKNQEFSWYRGYFIEVEGERFEELDLKFNTYSNSLYIKYQGKIYSLSGSNIQEFGLAEKYTVRRFVKDFGQVKSYEIIANFFLSSNETLQFLSQHPSVDVLSFKEFELNQISPKECKARIDLFSSQRSQVLSFVEDIRQHPKIKYAQLHTEPSSVASNAFFEILVAKKDFYLLKHNYKRISSHDSNSLAKHSSTISFDDSSYYLSNSNHQIQQLRFTKKSISLAFQNTQVPISTRIPNVRSEKQLVSWLQQFQH